MPYKADGKSIVPLLETQKSNWTNVAYSYFRNGITVRTPQYRFTKCFPVWKKGDTGLFKKPGLKFDE